MDYLLAIDIGGTNTRLALFKDDNLSEFLHLKHYHTADVQSLQALIEDYLQSLQATENLAIRSGCLCIAGIQEPDMIKMTNNKLVIRPSDVHTDFPMLYVNDFDGVAKSIEFLDEQYLIKCGGDTADSNKTIAVIGAGTGLGQGIIVPYDGQRLILSSEGGHINFAPIDERQIRLLQFLERKYEQVAWECVLSGEGLLNIYTFLYAVEGMAQNPEITEKINQNPGKRATILSQYSDDPLCRECIDFFLAMYGSQAGNVAVSLEAYGGVFISGGIMPNFIDYIEQSNLRLNFEAKGKAKKIAQRIPLMVINHPYPGLVGCACYAFESQSNG